MNETSVLAWPLLGSATAPVRRRRLAWRERRGLLASVALHATALGALAAWSAYEPRSGYANPVATTHAMAEAARREGVRFRDHVTVTAVTVEGDLVLVDIS